MIRLDSLLKITSPFRMKYISSAIWPAMYTTSSARQLMGLSDETTVLTMAGWQSLKMGTLLSRYSDRNILMSPLSPLGSCDRSSFSSKTFLVCHLCSKYLKTLSLISFGSCLYCEYCLQMSIFSQTTPEWSIEGVEAMIRPGRRRVNHHRRDGDKDLGVRSM